MWVGLCRHVSWAVSLCELNCVVMWVGLCCHVSWTVSSCELDCVVVWVGLCRYVSWTVSSCELDCVVMWVGLCRHVSWTVSLCELNCVVMWVGLCCHVSWTVSSCEMDCFVMIGNERNATNTSLFTPPPRTLSCLSCIFLMLLLWLSNKLEWVDCRMCGSVHCKGVDHALDFTSLSLFDW